MNWLKKLFLLSHSAHKPQFFGLGLLRYIGPGFLITVGFIDPGNWAVNLAAGAEYGYALLWVVTLSTIMLILLQNNAARLGIASGLCLSEAAMAHMPKKVALPILFSAVGAVVATSFAELLGAAIALRMLFGIPLFAGAAFTAIICIGLLTTNSYKKIEYWIIGLVSLIGIAFLYELSLVSPDWKEAGKGWVTPDIPAGSLLIIMSVLGAVVMPHNLFLHSEVIQSRQWQLEDKTIIQRPLKYELFDTTLSMGVGWAINSAMVILAACAFFVSNIKVDELEQAKILLEPLLGNNAASVFAGALLLAGFASTITAAMSGGSIVAGIFKEPYDSRDSHTRLGIIAPTFAALLGVAFISNTLDGLIISQALLSVQLPITMALLIWLTSSHQVMGKYVNGGLTKGVLFLLIALVAILNILLLLSLGGIISI